MSRVTLGAPIRRYGAASTIWHAAACPSSFSSSGAVISRQASWTIKQREANGQPRSASVARGGSPVSRIRRPEDAKRSSAEQAASGVPGLLSLVPPIPSIRKS